MKRTTVSISCDNCGKHIVEGHEHEVIIEIAGTKYTSDWCTECLHALKEKLSPDEPSLTCECGFVSKSERGLALHRRRRGH